MPWVRQYGEITMPMQRIHGRPRRYYVDGGAPYRADSLGSICADLGIGRRLNGSNDPEAKGAPATRRTACARRCR